MTETITLDLARKVIAAARKIELRRTPGLWYTSDEPLFCVRTKDGPVAALNAQGMRGDPRPQVERNASAICLWSGAFGALLEILETDIEELFDIGLGEEDLWPCQLKTIAALMSSLNAADSGWRER